MTAWFAFFGRDFLASTLGWSAEERGHYVTLLVAQWEQDGIPNDMSRLEIISPGVGACWHLLEDKFPIGTGGRRRNRRLESERLKAIERSEKARESSSKRWHPDGKKPSPEAEKRDSCDGTCEGICDGKCQGKCSGDASMTMSYSPPPPPPPASRVDGWKELRKAWNEAWNDKRQWRSFEPPPEAVARLQSPGALEPQGWLEEAIQAIPEIKRGACKGFETPPTLRQFCGIDKAGVSFVTRLLGGEFTDESLKRSRRARA
jgi:uncharacterized protein YdaU (DUF1376 family)